MQVAPIRADGRSLYTRPSVRRGVGAPALSPWARYFPSLRAAARAGLYSPMQTATGRAVLGAEDA